MSRVGRLDSPGALGKAQRRLLLPRIGALPAPLPRPRTMMRYVQEIPKSFSSLRGGWRDTFSLGMKKISMAMLKASSWSLTRDCKWSRRPSCFAEQMRMRETTCPIPLAVDSRRLPSSAHFPPSSFSPSSASALAHSSPPEEATASAPPDTGVEMPARAFLAESR